MLVGNRLKKWILKLRSVCFQSESCGTDLTCLIGSLSRFGNRQSGGAVGLDSGLPERSGLPISMIEQKFLHHELS